MEKPTLICVDDEKHILSSLKEQLKRAFKAQYIIETVESGEEALELLEELQETNVDIPLIISDQIMPGIKGDELLIQFHQKSPKTLKILLTGQADADAVGKIVNESELYRYIGKPWEQEDLILTVREAIRSYFQDKTLTEQNLELQNLNAELQQKITTFYKFVPSQFLNIIDLEKQEHIQLGECASCNMTILFSDIRSFTTLSENITAEENFRFINSYLSHMGPLIRQYGGFVDKYIGDAIMALFVSADDALSSSIAMASKLNDYNAGRKRAGYVPINMGVGINTGKLILGTVGEYDRMQTTVIGDSVNLASRTESLTKRYQTPIIITQHTLAHLENPDSFEIRFLDHVQIQGKHERVMLYEVLDPLPEALQNQKIEIRSTYEKALELFQQNQFQAAQELFQKCYTICPKDYISWFYLEQCQKQIANGKGDFEGENSPDLVRSVL